MKVVIESTPGGFKYAVACEQVQIIRGELSLVLDAEQSAKHGPLLLEEGFEFFKPNALEHIYFLREKGKKKIGDLGIVRIQ